MYLSKLTYIYTYNNMSNLNNKFMYTRKLFSVILVIGLIMMAGCEKKDPVKVITFAVQNITSVAATSGGAIYNEDDVTITARGVCWAITPKPTIASNKTEDGTGDGSFASTLKGLISNTVYYLRAYATVEGKTYYGPEVTFTTAASTELLKNGDFALPKDSKEYSPISLIPNWKIDDTETQSGRSFDGTNGIAWLWDGTSGIYQVVGTVPAEATKYSVSFDVACDYSYWAGPDFNIDVYAIFSAYSGTDATKRVVIDKLTFAAATDPYKNWKKKTGEYILPANNSHKGENLVFEIDIFNSRDWGYDESWTYLLFDNVSVKMSSAK